MCALALRWKYAVIVGAVALVVVTVPAFKRLGSEFMPPLDEGAPALHADHATGLSVTEAERLLQVQDRLIRTFPEVERVFGKAGRAETSTDPAPLSMFETVILLKPHREWRPGLTTEKLVEEMNARLSIPGCLERLDLAHQGAPGHADHGIRTPVGIKVYGADLHRIEQIGTRGGSPAESRWRARARCLPSAPAAATSSTSTGSATNWPRYGLSIAEAQMVVMSAIGGDNVTTTVEGRERYPVNVRYLRDYRSDVASLKRVLVPVMDGRMQIPIAQLAEVKLAAGPSMLRDENGMLNGYVYVDISGRDVGGYVEEAKALVAAKLKLPPGLFAPVERAVRGHWRGCARKLKFVLPLTLFLIVVLLYLNTRSMPRPR